jgi:hypothetical protein
MFVMSHYEWLGRQLLTSEENFALTLFPIYLHENLMKIDGKPYHYEADN